MNSKIFSLIAAIVIAITAVLGGTYYYLSEHSTILEPSPDASQGHSENTQDTMQNASESTPRNSDEEQNLRNLEILQSQQNTSQTEEPPLDEENISQRENFPETESLTEGNYTDQQDEYNSTSQSEGQSENNLTSEGGEQSEYNSTNESEEENKNDSMVNETQEQRENNLTNESSTENRPFTEDESSIEEEQNSIKEETQEAEHTPDSQKPEEKLNTAREYQQKGKDSRLEPKLSSEFVEVYVMNGKILNDYRVNLLKDLLKPVRERSKDYNLSVFVEMLPKGEMGISIYNKGIIFSDNRKFYKYITVDKLKPYLGKPQELSEKVGREEIIERINFEIKVNTKGSDFSRHIKSLENGLNAAQYFFPFCEVIQISAKE